MPRPLHWVSPPPGVPMYGVPAVRCPHHGVSLLLGVPVVGCLCHEVSLLTVSPVSPVSPEEVELELRLARFERLMARRPLLLNSVLLRQNPHNVHEWHKRVQLYQGQPQQVTRGGDMG